MKESAKRFIIGNMVHEQLLYFDELDDKELPVKARPEQYTNKLLLFQL